MVKPTASNHEYMLIVIFGIANKKNYITTFTLQEISVLQKINDHGYLMEHTMPVCREARRKASVRKKLTRRLLPDFWLSRPSLKAYCPLLAPANFLPKLQLASSREEDEGFPGRPWTLPREMWSTFLRVCFSSTACVDALLDAGSVWVCIWSCYVRGYKNKHWQLSRKPVQMLYMVQG